MREMHGPIVEVLWDAMTRLPHPRTSETELHGDTFTSLLARGHLLPYKEWMIGLGWDNEDVMMQVCVHAFLREFHRVFECVCVCV